MTIRPDEQDTIVYPGAEPLQIVVWSGQRVHVVTTGTPQRLELPLIGNDACVCVEISSAQDAWIALGDNTVVTSAIIASDGPRFFLAGVQVVPVPRDAAGNLATHISVIKVSGQGGVFQVERVR